MHKTDLYRAPRNTKRDINLAQFVCVWEFCPSLLVLTVEAQNDFGEETSGPKGDKMAWFTYEINK